MIIIHAADIHLGSPLGGLDQHEGLPVERLRAAPLEAFRRIARLCAEREADLLLIAGDLFDGDASPIVIRQASDVLREIAATTNVVMIRGNHDAASKMQRRLPEIEGVTELSNTEPVTHRLDELGVAVHGRGFDKPKVDSNIVPSYPAAVPGAFNIGLLHTSLAGNARHDKYAPCEVADMVERGYDYWALGHIHQHEIVAQDPWIVYAGSPQARHIGEAGAHGVYVLQVEDGALVGAPEHVELGVVQWHRLVVEAADPELDAEQLCEQAAAAVGELVDAAPGDVQHVIRLELTGRCAAHDELVAEPGRWRERLLGDVESAGCFAEKILVRVAPALPDPSELRERDDFIGNLARHVEGLQERERDDDDPAPPGGMPVVLEKLDKKLRVLAADGDLLRGEVASSAERLLAADELIARLLVAVDESQEAI
jgi:DNA repair exonuclease SbcCD nuclease subunit